MEIADLLLRHRRRRRMSQLEVAQAAGVSARHLSYVERGLSRPGRAVIAAVARALALPHRETNRLLRAAGERPLYPEHGLADEAVAPLRVALERLIGAHMPWPALVVDHAWQPLRANPACTALLAYLARYTRRPLGTDSLMDWLFAPDGLWPLVRNQQAVGPFLIERVRREAVAHPDLDPLLARLEDRVPAAAEAPVDDGVVLSLQLRVGDAEPRLFSVLAGFGSALDATFQTLRIEYLFPEDAATGRWLESIATEGDGGDAPAAPDGGDGGRRG